MNWIFDIEKERYRSYLQFYFSRLDDPFDHSKRDHSRRTHVISRQQPSEIYLARWHASITIIVIAIGEQYVAEARISTFARNDRSERQSGDRYRMLGMERRKFGRFQVAEREICEQTERENGSIRISSRILRRALRPHCAHCDDNYIRRSHARAPIRDSLFNPAEAFERERIRVRREVWKSHFRPFFRGLVNSTDSKLTQTR